MNRATQRIRLAVCFLALSLVNSGTTLVGQESQNRDESQDLQQALKRIESLESQLGQLQQTLRADGDSQNDELVKETDPNFTLITQDTRQCCCGKCYECLCPLEEAQCLDCPRVSTLGSYFNVRVFGALKLDMQFSEPRSISKGSPFFLVPDSQAGLDQNTLSIHARQSTIGAALTGPRFGGFQSGGLVAALFFNDAIIIDRYGFLPLQAYGELKNENWRFAAGLQFDVFNPGVPTVLPFSVLSASGNSGNAFRGQVRLERFITPSENLQWTLQAALSEPVAATIDPEFRLIDDNGWPNIEARIAVGIGEQDLSGLVPVRPFQLGISGVGGQIRTTGILTNKVVADVWGIGADFRWKVTPSFGFAGEFFTGQGLGTYGGGVLQNINVDSVTPSNSTLESIRSTGGWLETFVFWTPCLHSHFGFGIDDPIDRDVGVTQRTQNSTAFANLIWDLNQTFRIGMEFTYRETKYRSPLLLDNEGPGFHTQFQWSF